MMEGRNEGNGAINCILLQQTMQTFIQQFWQCTKCNVCHLNQIIFKQYGHWDNYSFKCFTSLFGLISVWKTFTFLCATLYTSNCIYYYVFYMYLDTTPYTYKDGVEGRLNILILTDVPTLPPSWLTLSPLYQCWICCWHYDVFCQIKLLYELWWIPILAMKCSALNWYML